MRLKSINYIKLIGIFSALILCILLKILFCLRIIVSPSMLPTIQLEDIILVYKYSNIKRGDIVLFFPPESQHTNQQEWIKRIVGLPGDVITIKNGKIYINDKLLSENYNIIKPDYELAKLQITNDSYFVLGDNRNNSNDSHVWGSLPRKNIIGKVVLKVWPKLGFP